MSDLTERIKDKIQARRWKFARDTSPYEGECTQWANRMNTWCLEIIDEESAKEEQDEVSAELRILKNYIRHMTKAYRLRTDNASVVHDILLSGTSIAGRTSCIAKCRELGIDPYGHDLESEAMK